MSLSESQLGGGEKGGGVRPQSPQSLSEVLGLRGQRATQVRSGLGPDPREALGGLCSPWPPLASHCSVTGGRCSVGCQCSRPAHAGPSRGAVPSPVRSGLGNGGFTTAPWWSDRGCREGPGGPRAGRRVKVKVQAACPLAGQQRRPGAVLGSSPAPRPPPPG